VFENRVLRRIYGSKREEVVGGWGRVRNEELHNLNASPNVIRVFISRRMSCVEYVTCVGEIRNAYKIYVRKLKGRDHSEDQVVDGETLEWILGKKGRKMWTGCI